MANIEGKANGFFKQKHLSFRKQLSQNDINSFSLLKNDEERFEFVYNRPELPTFEITALSSDKNESAANLLKEDGNKAFQSGQYGIALNFYTKSILKSPRASDQNATVAIIRANRSAALYHLGEYKLAIHDIDTAISLGYPKDLLYKVKDRKAKCFLALKQHKSALLAFQETLTSLDDANLKADRRNKWQMDVQIMIAMIKKTNAGNEEEKIEPKQDVIDQKNPVYKAASTAVTIKKTESLGRFAEAKVPIKAGDIILTEEPHAAVLLEEYSKTHCFQCFKRLKAPEPCPNCSRVAFCSDNCLQKALSSHHKYECGILPVLWASGASITCLLALRILLQRESSYFIQFKLKEQTECKLYQTSDYSTVYNLVTHEEKRTVEDFLHRTHMAVFLFFCLKESGYLNQPDYQKGHEKIIGGLLVHNLQFLQFNAHEVSELIIEGEGLSKTKSVFLGGAVYPTLALFNHSCNPAITRYFIGTRVVARAIRNLAKEEMIAENYGPIFTQTPRKERQQTLLSQYWFNCSCEACIDDWPVMEKMDPKILRFHCEAKDRCKNVICVPTNTSQFMIKCVECGEHTNILKGLKVLQDTENIFRIGQTLMEEGDNKKALKKFLELLSLLDEILAPPFKDFHLCQQAIRTCFLTLGNKYLLPEPLKRTATIQQ